MRDGSGELRVETVICGHNMVGRENRVNISRVLKCKIVTQHELAAHYTRGQTVHWLNV